MVCVINMVSICHMPSGFIFSMRQHIAVVTEKSDMKTRVSLHIKLCLIYFIANNWFTTSRLILTYEKYKGIIFFIV